MKRIILDTNLLVYREDPKKMDSKVLLLNKYLYSSEEYKIYIHPVIFKDSQMYRDDEKREIFENKLSIYPRIELYPTPTGEFISLVGEAKNHNDEVDNTILFAIYANCADILISNDLRLVKKAGKCGLEKRVLGIDDAIILLAPKQIEIKNPAFIFEKHIYQLDLKDPFFDSLKEDYFQFVEWLEKKSRKGDKAYVSYKEPNKLGSFLLLKIENENESYGDFDVSFTKSKRVKISTFKVSDFGKRIGESFLKTIFQYTQEHKIDEIYVTIFDKQIELIDLFSQFGFTFFCYKNTKNAEGTIVKEGVYLKKISDHNYPHLKYTNQNIFVIPILPKFHLKLFKESETVYQISIEDVDGISTYSNSIKKAYLSNSNIKKLKKGDILFFYASKTKQAITTIGVVDAIFTDFSSIEEIYNLVNKITVYTREEIEKIFSKESKVIMFKYYSSLNPTIPLSKLINDDIVKAAPQTITEISQPNISRLLDIVKESTQVIK